MTADIILGKIFFMTFCLVCAFLDKKHREIDILVFEGMLAAEIIWYIAAVLNKNVPDIRDMLFGAGIGAAVFIVSLLSGGAVGKGDGIFLSLTGIILGGRRNFIFFISAVMLSALFGAGYILKIKFEGNPGGKNPAKKTFPFLPFFLPAAVYFTFTGVLR